MGMPSLPEALSIQRGGAVKAASWVVSSAATVCKSACDGRDFSSSIFSERAIAVNMALIAINANDPTITIVATTPVFVESASVAITDCHWAHAERDSTFAELARRP
jgi:hypothetical protein